MSGRVLSFEAGVHKVVDALLPWYVNGTLSPEERDYVHQHVGECAQCRQEIEWLRELHSACAAAQSTPAGSLALRNLRRRLDEPPPERGVWSRLRRALENSTRGARWATAALVIVLVASVSWALRDGESPALYRTLSASDVMPRNGSLIVVFDPATTEAELRRILREADARLVDGPTRANAYVLDVPIERRDVALRALRSERSVLLVERLTQEGKP